MAKKKPVRKTRKVRKAPKVIILDDNPLSMICYLQEFGEGNDE